MSYRVQWLEAEVGRLQAQRDDLQGRNTELVAERQALQSELEKLRKSYNRVFDDRERLREELAERNVPDPGAASSPGCE